MHIQRGKVATRIGSYGCVKCSSESSHSFKIVTACGNSTMVAVQKSASYTYSCAAMKYILVTTERQLQRRTISKYFGTHSRRKLAARPPLHFPTILAIFIVVVLEAIVVSVQLFAAGEKEYGRASRRREEALPSQYISGDGDRGLTHLVVACLESAHAARLIRAVHGTYKARRNVLFLSCVVSGFPGAMRFVLVSVPRKDKGGGLRGNAARKKTFAPRKMERSHLKAAGEAREASSTFSLPNREGVSGADLAAEIDRSIDRLHSPPSFSFTPF